MERRETNTWTGTDHEGPNRGGFDEGRPLFMCRACRLDVFVRRARTARFSSSCRTIRGRIRFTRGGTHSSWAGCIVDRIRAVPASADNGAPHAARVALLTEVERRWKNGQ